MYALHNIYVGDINIVQITYVYRVLMIDENIVLDCLKPKEYIRIYMSQMELYIV